MDRAILAVVGSILTESSVVFCDAIAKYKDSESDSKTCKWYDCNEKLPCYCFSGRFGDGHAIGASRLTCLGIDAGTLC